MSPESQDKLTSQTKAFPVVSQTKESPDSLANLSSATKLGRSFPNFQKKIKCRNIKSFHTFLKNLEPTTNYLY